MRTLYPATADRWQAPWLVGANDSCRPRCEEHEPKNAKKYYAAKVVAERRARHPKIQVFTLTTNGQVRLQSHRRVNFHSHG
jgi:hypothetical protein